MKDIQKRKFDHIKICLEQNVKFKSKSNGFEKWDFEHFALPEQNFNSINTEISFLNKKLSFPFMIAGMTGGFDGGEEINLKLARIAEEIKVAFGTGSMRPLCEKPELMSTYKNIRKICYSIPFIGNVGAVNLFREISENDIKILVDELELDALVLHLNPLQEIIQEEGDKDFSNIVSRIEKLVKLIEIPVIVKETGAGISGRIAKKIKDAGVKIIDVAGAGGTSWAAVESYRCENKEKYDPFRDWGIPTTDCIVECADILGLVLIASGGIENGIQIAKSLALGADLSAAALPILNCLVNKEEEGVLQLLNTWHDQLKICLFLTGCRKIKDLDRTKIRKVG